MKPVLSSKTQITLQTFGQMIKTARLERNMSQQDLAERTGVTRQTIILIEKGNPKVAIGTVFEVAGIVGIPLLSESRQGLQQLSTTVGHLTSLLPERAGKASVELDDDF